MACHGGFSLDEAKRRKWYNPEGILREAGVRKGSVFMDVGCNGGFFTLIAAEMVGETGRVYAVDVDAEAIERLKRRASERGFQNVHAAAGKAEETIFCTECADFVFFSMALHDFHDPALRNAKRMLKLSGMLVDLDWKKEPVPFGPPESIKFSTDYAGKLMADAGLVVQSVKDAGPYHYLITAKLKP